MSIQVHHDLLQMLEFHDQMILNFNEETMSDLKIIKVLSLQNNNIYVKSLYF